MFKRLMTKRRARRRQSAVEPGFRKMEGLHYHAVISEIEARIRPDWYLEIGSRSGTSIAHRHCNFIAIDPTFAIKAPVFNAAPEMHFFQMTSDAFFARGYLERMGIMPDFAFIDGMHLFEFALRDFMNTERAMAHDGIILLHDICPFNHEMTVRDYETHPMHVGWTGDVWKLIVILKELRPDLKIDVLSAASTGLACVSNLNPDSCVLIDAYEDCLATYTAMTLQDYGAERYFDLAAPVDPVGYLEQLKARG